MNEHQLHRALNDLDDEMIGEVGKLRESKKKPAWARLCAVAACAVVLLGASALILSRSGFSVGSTAHATDLLAGITANTLSPSLHDRDELDNAYTDFSLRLFQAANRDDENTLISPLSVAYAMSMASNGAGGETRAQMETVMGISNADLDQYLLNNRCDAENTDGAQLKIANSMWFREKGFTPNNVFLQVNADYLGTQLYTAPFDGSTCREINDWVKENTDGMIPEILDTIPADAMVYLVDALAFDAQWDEAYKSEAVTTGTFHGADGDTQAQFLNGGAWYYMEDENTTGFLKEYKGCRYAFAAFLPKECGDLSDYVATMDGEKVTSLLRNAQTTQAITAIPKFETESSTELQDILSGMGMDLAFDPMKADFSPMGTCDIGKLCISRVIHKTFLSLTESGTRAGAATLIENRCGASPEEPKRVILDRPFVYMIIDCDTDTPLFIGTLLNIK